jgi:transcriptional regulator with XRE-family HTH domain
MFYDKATCFTVEGVFLFYNKENMFNRRWIDMQPIGEVLKEIREEKGLSLREAAEKSGLSHSYIRYLEKGERPGSNTPINPTPDALRKLSDAYSHPYEDLMYRAGYIEESSVYSSILENEKEDVVSKLKSIDLIELLKKFNELMSSTMDKDEYRQMIHEIFADDKEAIEEFEKIIENDFESLFTFEKLDTTDRITLFKDILSTIKEDQLLINKKVIDGRSTFQLSFPLPKFIIILEKILNGNFESTNLTADQLINNFLQSISLELRSILPDKFEEFINIAFEHMAESFHDNEDHSREFISEMISNSNIINNKQLENLIHGMTHLKNIKSQIPMPYKLELVTSLFPDDIENLKKYVDIVQEYLSRVNNLPSGIQAWLRTDDDLTEQEKEELQDDLEEYYNMRKQRILKEREKQ